jgi:pimeloyl-[acyl-carrier protein] methyl ester esterase
MTLTRRSMFAAATLLAPTLALAMAPHAFAEMAPKTRLFKDTRLIVRDRFSVEVVGRGKDLVFLPGMASSRETWRATAERLRNHYRLHLVQVAGFAGEPVRANATGEVLIPLAEAIDAYLVEARIAPATFIGHSMGGTIGLYLAQKHPEHLKKLMVVDSAPFLAQVMGFPSAEAAKPMVAMLRRPPTAASAAQTQQQIRSMVTAPADQEMVLGWGRASVGEMVGRTYAEDILLDLRPGLRDMRTPVTLVYPGGAAFGLTAEQMQANYVNAFAGMPNLTMCPVMDSRHFVMLDQPQRFAEELDLFLK